MHSESLRNVLNRELIAEVILDQKLRMKIVQLRSYRCLELKNKRSEEISGSARFQVLTAASMMFRVVFWDILPCKMIVDRRFRGAYCLHHHP
jgi:hypothetical protein